MNIELTEPDNTVAFQVAIDTDDGLHTFEEEALPANLNGKAILDKEREFFQKAQHLSKGTDKPVRMQKSVCQYVNGNDLDLDNPLMRTTWGFRKGDVVSQDIDALGE